MSDPPDQPSSRRDVAHGGARALWWRLRPHLPALALLAAAAAFYLYRIDAWRINDDEEGYLYAAWRIALGEVPYRDFLTPQLPAFLFPGGLVVGIFGRDAAALRAWSSLLVLGSAWFTYLIGRRMIAGLAGLVAMAVLLVAGDIFAVARAFRPEATMLVCITAAVYAFVRADELGHRGGYAASSLMFAVGLLAKLFAALPWAATVAFVAAAGALGRRWRPTAADVLALSAPGAVLVTAVMAVFLWLEPRTYEAVIGHHLMQGAGLSRLAVVRKTFEFYWSAVHWHAGLLAFAPLGLYAAVRASPRRGWLFAWQLGTVVAFFALGRELWARHLVYLLPTLCLLTGAAVWWLLGGAARGRRAIVAAAATIVLAIGLPYALEDLEAARRSEVGTDRIAALVRALAPRGSRLLSDYPGIGFYSGVATTYSGAGLSEGATESGQITGAELARDLDAGNVSLVLLDEYSSGGNILSAPDAAAFRAALVGGYAFLGKFWREYQPHAVYAQKDWEWLGVGFGWATLDAVSVPERCAPDRRCPVVAVFRVRERADRPLTAFLHLVGHDGATWAQGDRLLDNALKRTTEEWEPGEIVAVPLDLPVEPGTPPGPYEVEIGLYDPTTGARLPWHQPGGAAGDAYRAGTIEVALPDRPARERPSRAAGRPMGARAGVYELLAGDVPASARAGWPLPVRLTWRATRPPNEDDRVDIRVVGEGGATLGRAVVPPGGEYWPTRDWRAGEIATTLAAPVVDPDAAAQSATVLGTLLGPDGRPLGEAMRVAGVQIDAQAPVEPSPPDISRPIDGRLGDRLSLVGADPPSSVLAGSRRPVTLTLYWQASAPVTATYTVLVHVVDGSGNIVAQADGAPAGGDRPTTSWRRGEIIADRRVVALPGDLPAGTYDVHVGLYDASAPGYPRLPAAIAGSASPDGRLRVGEIAVVPGE